MKQTQIVSFATQKGGCGKSKLTQAIPLIIKKLKPLSKILILDCEYQSGRISEIRESDIQNFGANGEKIKPLVEIVHVLPKDYFSVLKECYGQYDYIFVDIPGFIAQKEILDIFLTVNHIFIVFVKDRAELLSSIEFTQKMREISNVLIEAGESAPKLYAIINKFSNLLENKSLEPLIEALGLEKVPSNIPMKERLFVRSINTLYAIEEEECKELYDTAKFLLNNCK